MIALANEPEAEGLLRLVWSGEGPETGPLRALKAALDDPAAPAGLRDILTADADIREKLATLPPPPERGDPTSALRALEAIGLAEAGRSREDDDNPDWSCHEIVRERIEAWMRARAEDRGELSADSVRLAYAEGLIADFEALRSLRWTPPAAPGRAPSSIACRRGHGVVWRNSGSLSSRTSSIQDNWSDCWRRSSKPPRRRRRERRRAPAC